MAQWRSIPRRLYRLARRDPDHGALLAEAAFWLLTARIALLLIPFSRLARRLGIFVPPADPRVKARMAMTSGEQAAVAARVGWAITRAARHVPFHAVCLPQAIAARQMLNRRGISSVLHFGAMAEKGKTLSAHAWLDAAGVEVTGFPVEAGLVELACFV